MAKQPPPLLTNEIRDYADVIAAELRERLLAIAEQIATCQKNDTVQKRDVKQALLALKRAGLYEALERVAELEGELSSSHGRGRGAR